MKTRMQAEDEVETRPKTHRDEVPGVRGPLNKEMMLEVLEKVQSGRRPRRRQGPQNQKSVGSRCRAGQQPL